MAMALGTFSLNSKTSFPACNAFNSISPGLKVGRNALHVKGISKHKSLVLELFTQQLGYYFRR